MMDELLLSVDDGVALVTFNRPDSGNAWTALLDREYQATLQELDADPAVRVIVVTGAGRSYCVGADFKRLQGFSEGQPKMPDGPRFLRAGMLRKPVVAAINGGCAGIGFLQALACDVRFANASAKITGSFPRRGLTAEEGSAWFLTRMVGLGNAMDLLLSGRVITGVEAAQIGLVSQVSDGDVVGEALAYAKEMARHCSPTSMAVIKREVYRQAEMSMESSIAESRAAMLASFARSDLSEGIASFTERRDPSFAPIENVLDELPFPYPDAELANG